MYDEKENAQEITLLDMVNSLIKKWKIIVWVTLAALILGAVAGLGMALIANRNYGTRVEFFVSSDKANNQLLSVLKSDKYAEALLMDENGLPGEFKNTEEYAAAKALLEQEESLEKLLEEQEEALEPYEIEISILSRESTEAQTAYNEALSLLEMYKKADGQALEKADAEALKNHFATLKRYENEVEEARTTKEQKRNKYNEKVSEKQELEKAIKELTKEIANLQKEKDKALGVLHDMYIGVEGNAKKVEDVKKRITCGFVDSKATEEQLASSAVVYVDIAVPSDEAAANELLKQVSDKTVDFVIDSVNTKEEPTCTNLSAFATVEKIEVYGPIMNTVKFGAIAAVAAFALMCVAVIAIDVFKPKKTEENVNALPESAE